MSSIDAIEDELELKMMNNPVGTAHQIDCVDRHVRMLCEKWDEQKELEESTPWWKWWANLGTRQLVKVTNFLIKALDDLIQLVDREVDDGPDKKATVLMAIGALYDYVIREAMPIWLRPFAARVKDYVVNTLISSAIDWIVGKYRHGSWREDIPDPIPLPEL